mmetsp:Transcript_19835/g.47858  ORF Transcript_19835/g.47858 Transcript_19835/m.47858 type:complete len:81 (+) Transcript_19835:152-394(+)
MSLVQIMSLDDEWLQKKRLWDGKNKLPKTDNEVTAVIHNTRWSDEEKKTVLRMRSEGRTNKEIAAKLGRSTRSCQRLVHY